MFSHPVSITGYIFVVVAAVLYWAEPGSTFDSQVGFALLVYALAGAGPFLILLGVIAQGFWMLDGTLREIAPRSDTRTDKFKPLSLSGG
jgi:hypothetical protein